MTSSTAPQRVATTPTPAIPPPWPDAAAGGQAISDAWLAAECHRLLDFGDGFPHPAGAAWLDARGVADLDQPVHTWVTARMAHTYSLGHLLGRPGDAELAWTALAGLRGRLRDHRHGGWHSSIASDGTIPDEKTCSTHAVVVLAATSATIANLDGSEEMLEEALQVWEDRFFDPHLGLYLDRWNLDFTVLDPYRGLTANMHAVEALLAAADVTERPALRHRALKITERVAELARTRGWRIPEHLDPLGGPLLEHHRAQPDHPSQPYGATVGHALEWARLMLNLEASLERPGPPWLLPAAVALFDRAVADGWAVDGADGFVYTTDWSGRPVVRARMHWVVAEAIATAATLHRRTGNPRYLHWEATWWRYAQRHLLDLDHGSWHHQLEPTNTPSDTGRSGKPDLYHAVQATLIPRLPLAPSLATALLRGDLRG